MPPEINNAKDAINWLKGNIVKLELLTCANLKGFDDFGDNELKELMKFCPNLEKISLENMPVTRVSSGHLSELGNLREVSIISCPSFESSEHLSESELENLKKLSIMNCPSFTEDGLAQILTSIPIVSLAINEQLFTNGILQCVAEHRTDIQELKCHAHSRIGYNDTMNLTEGFAAIAANCKALTCIDFVPKGVYSFNLNPEEVSILIENNPNLTNINLGACIQDQHLALLSTSHPNLTSISLYQCPFSEQALLDFSEGCPNIESFSLFHDWTLHDETLMQMADNWKSLEALNLFTCHKISFISIEHIVQNCPLESFTATPP